MYILGAEDAFTAYQTTYWPARIYFAGNDQISDLYTPTLEPRFDPEVVDEVATLSDSLKR